MEVLLIEDLCHLPKVLECERLSKMPLRIMKGHI